MALSAKSGYSVPAKTYAVVERVDWTSSWKFYLLGIVWKLQKTTKQMTQQEKS